VGFSDNGLLDPLVGVPQIRAVIWKKDGKIIDLGTLKGGFESLAVANNNRGEVTGVSSNDVPDSTGGSFFGTEIHAFLWRAGVIRDLGTLGDDPDSISVSINDSGQVTGFSFNISGPNARQHPFLWDNGNMLDLGTLGGNFAQPVGLNSRGQVTGVSDPPGAEPGVCTFQRICDPFLWDRGSLTDLGTFGGTFGEPNFIKDDGDVVGDATFPDGTQHAALWKGGKIKDLGTVDSGCSSTAWAINSNSQVVGISASCGASSPLQLQAFLWENGSMVDLNTLGAPPSSGLQLVVAQAINDRGEIAGFGALPTGDARAFVLIPCDEEHLNVAGCDYHMVEASTLTSQSSNFIDHQQGTATRLSLEAMRGFMQSSGLHSTPWFRRGSPRPQN
jgi:probable HAF family extracellular repeat protein